MNHERWTSCDFGVVCWLLCWISFIEWHKSLGLWMMISSVSSQKLCSRRQKMPMSTVHIGNWKRQLTSKSAKTNVAVTQSHNTAVWICIPTERNTSSVFYHHLSYRLWPIEKPYLILIYDVSDLLPGHSSRHRQVGKTTRTPIASHPSTRLANRLVDNWPYPYP